MTPHAAHTHVLTRVARIDHHLERLRAEAETLRNTVILEARKHGWTGDDTTGGRMTAHDECRLPMRWTSATPDGIERAVVFRDVSQVVAWVTGGCR